ncbi:hypothetical protein EV193_101864 [Herbihabitans rhizosphaerae]|uniref:Endonuclease/exonuclease/phosphatase domain-containing protein n=1 Tax=Herbihabitans rhizosphaerae TaxID=1872711 RepID=A0A4Q7L8J4_9PSEU|nr:endonuclease/exonuclease/phosphatase family protein [Herbihabitans rhizosphaerae]RZS44981.1 hypothetical protein EV193_101864 [Herbihabitans rhizosphaerae]
MTSPLHRRLATLGVAVAAASVGLAVAASAEAPRDPTTISQIQGTTRISPLNGQKVTKVRGIVTGVRLFGSARGFWFQDPNPDKDPRTSEGLFVFTGNNTPPVRPGNALLVSGTVKEYYPDDPAKSAFQSMTELVEPEWTLESPDNPIPDTEILGPLSVPAALAPDTGGNIEPLQLEPAKYALDFYESREGMRLRVDDARVVGPSNQYNELYVTSKPAENPSARGGAVYLGYDKANTGRLKVQSLIPFAQRPFPKVNVGDKLAGLTEGPLDYGSFGGYTLQATAIGKETAGGIQPETTRKQGDDELAVATYNVENLDAADEQAKFDRLAKGVVTNLASPDIVVVEEIQDNNGATDDGTVMADATFEKFVDTIAKAGGPRYLWRQIDPVNKADGGEPGGNIRVGFLFNADRVQFVDKPGGDAATAVQVVTEQNGRAGLTISPGRVDPANGAWKDSRKPLVGQFTFNDKSVFVVANHFASKGGDQPMHGRTQPPVRTSEAQREQQATAVRALVDQIQKVEPGANVLVAGDLNDFQFSKTVGTLTAGGALRALIDSLGENERYGYVFEGNSQVLDHILVSGAPRNVEYDVVHINAEFHDQGSDHDPSVVRLRPTAKRGLGPK